MLGETEEEEEASFESNSSRLGKLAKRQERNWEEERLGAGAGRIYREISSGAVWWRRDGAYHFSFFFSLRMTQCLRVTNWLAGRIRTKLMDAS